MFDELDASFARPDLPAHFRKAYCAVTAFPERRAYETLFSTLGMFFVLTGGGVHEEIVSLGR